jgi:putative redox protein
MGKLGYAIKVRNFTLNSDVPESLGGENLGPTPHEFLEAALAACTAITLQMYAERKKIPLQSSDVQIKILQEGETNRISREIQLQGELSAEQKTLLMSIADKCPIHKFLTHPTEIESHLRTPWIEKN